MAPHLTPIICNLIIHLSSAHARSASHALHGEPPHSGGNSGGGIRKAVAFPCGNAAPCARLRRARVGFFVKSNLVDLAGIEPATRQCECRVMPLYYKPLRETEYLTNTRSSNAIRVLIFCLALIIFYSAGKFILNRLNSSEFETTETELSAIAAEANIGLMNVWVEGYKTPIATGTSRAL